MSALSLLYLFAFAVFLTLALQVLRRDIRSRLNWSCALFLLAFAVWSFEDVFHGNPSLPADLVNRFSDIGNVGRFAAPSLFLWFVLTLTRKSSLSRPPGLRPRLARAASLLLMLGLPLLLLVMFWTRQVPWQNHRFGFGWVVVWGNSFWAFVYYAYCAGLLLLGAFLLYQFLRRTASMPERRQAAVILATTLTALVLGGISDVIFPNVLHWAFPELAGAFTLIWASGLYYSVTRLGMMRITAKAAADEILATMRDSLLLLSPEGRIVSVNQAARDLLEYPEAELVGKPAAMLFTSPGLYAAALQQVRDAGELKYLELTCRTRLGKEIPASISAQVMRRRRGAEAGIVWVVRDISGRQEHEAALRRAYSELESMVRERTEELQRANEQLRSSEERFRAIFESAPDAYYLADLTGHIVDANEASEKLAGYGRSEFVGKNALKLNLLPNVDVSKVLRLLARLALRQPSGPDEFTLRRKDGTLMLLEVMTHPVKLGGRLLVLAIARDVSERRRTEKELEAHRQHLEELVAERTRELTQAQSELVKREKQATLGQIAASMAHELRNPLGAMHNAVLYLNMAEWQALSEKGLRHLAVIDQQIERSNRIITALLDFAETQPPAPRAVPVSKVLDEALHRVTAPENVSVTKEVSADVPPIFADPEQVKVALGNLIENALLAMPDGGRLRLRTAERKCASAQERQVAARWVQIAVEDTGCGIKAENLPRLFEPLFSTRTVGVGLGLPIARKLVEANQGTISVESEPGRGATFTVTLPAGE